MTQTSSLPQSLRLEDLCTFKYELESALSPYAFILRGVCNLDANDRELLNAQHGIAHMHAIALVGSVGSVFWRIFSQSAEYQDGTAHALDRYSQRIAQSIAPRLDAHALFPFQGPPYLPFLRWAQMSEALAVSPIKINIHRTYGLWHAYRFALALPFEFEELLQKPQTDQNSDTHDPMLAACVTCKTQPCLHACPVAAFSNDSYDKSICIKHLATPAGQTCMQQGCRARYACPEAPNYRYEQAHCAFHMQAFLASCSN